MATKTAQKALAGSSRSKPTSGSTTFLPRITPILVEDPDPNFLEPSFDLEHFWISFKLSNTPPEDWAVVFKKKASGEDRNVVVRNDTLQVLVSPDDSLTALRAHLQQLAHQVTADLQDRLGVLMESPEFRDRVERIHQQLAKMTGKRS